MEEKIFQPDKSWVKILLIRESVILFCLLLATILLALFWTPYSLIVMGLLIAVFIVNIVVQCPKKTKIIINQNGTITANFANYFKRYTVTCSCLDIVDIKVKKEFYRIFIVLTTTNNEKIRISNNYFSNQELKIIIDEIQKRGGLKDYKIDF